MAQSRDAGDAQQYLASDQIVADFMGVASSRPVRGFCHHADLNIGCQAMDKQPLAYQLLLVHGVHRAVIVTLDQERRHVRRTGCGRAQGLVGAALQQVVDRTIRLGGGTMAHDA